MTSKAKTSLDSIEKLFGPDRASYVANKHRGGLNNDKGGRYELLFAAVRVASVVPDVASGKRISVTKQAPEFVDDFQMYGIPEGIKSDYQLKNVATLRWSHNDGQLVTDFADQQRLNREHLGCKSVQYLVVPTEALEQQLLGSRPAEISAHSQVLRFPDTNGSSNRLLQESHDVRVALERASSSSDTDKLEAVFGALMLAWQEEPAGTAVDVEKVIRRAQSYSSSYLRVIDQVPPIDEGVRAVLGGIAGFEYEVFGGFLKWRYADADRGQLSYSCLDKRFATFCQLVLRGNPTTFDEIEGLLLS